jgi:hypothetical protein
LDIVPKAAPDDYAIGVSQYRICILPVGNAAAHLDRFTPMSNFPEATSQIETAQANLTNEGKWAGPDDADF